MFTLLYTGVDVHVVVHRCCSKHSYTNVGSNIKYEEK